MKASALWVSISSNHRSADWATYWAGSVWSPPTVQIQSKVKLWLSLHSHLGLSFLIISNHVAWMNLQLSSTVATASLGCKHLKGNLTLRELIHFYENVITSRASPTTQAVKNSPAMQEKQEMWVRSLGWEDLLEEEMTTHSCILARKILWTEETGRSQSPRGRKESDTTWARHIGAIGLYGWKYKLNLFLPLIPIHLPPPLSSQRFIFSICKKTKFCLYEYSLIIGIVLYL